MNEADYLYLDREKGRIEYELSNALDSGSKAELDEMIERIEEYKALKFGSEEPITVKSVLQELSDLSQGVAITNADTGKPVSLEDFQDLVFQKVEMLASILGAELEG